MNISKLIEALQKIQNGHGDLQVSYVDNGDSACAPDDIELDPRVCNGGRVKIVIL